MSTNPIKRAVAPVRSPWGGFDVIVVPDDDDDARKSGIPSDVLLIATQEHPVIDGKTIFIRATLWEQLKAELAALGQIH